MEKAYDLKDLGERLKAQGIPLLRESAEETAKVVYEQVKAWAKESAPLSQTKVDDVVAAYYDQLDPMVYGLIDKIDGKEG